MIRMGDVTQKEMKKRNYKGAEGNFGSDEYVLYLDFGGGNFIIFIFIIFVKTHRITPK